MTTPTTSPHFAPTSPRDAGRPQKCDLAPRPLPVGGEVALDRHAQLPPTTHLAPTPTGEVTRPCGHTNGPWTCILGPHEAGRHYYVKAAS